MIAALIIPIVLLNSLLAFIVLIKNPRNNINLSFAFFVISVVAWMIVNTLSNSVTDHAIAFILNKLIFIFVPYVSFGLLYFSLVFPTNLWNIKTKYLLLLIVPVIVSNIFTFLNLVISDVTFLKEGGTGVVFGSGIVFFSLQFLLYFIVSIIFLVYKYLKSKGFQRVQLQYMLFGISIFLVSATITNLIIPLVYDNFLITNLGPFFSIATFGFTAYSILRHRLLDIRFVIARTVAYSIMVLILAIMYGFAWFIVGTSFFPVSNSYAQLSASTILAVIMAFSFQPLLILVKKVTDKIFFKNLYNSQSFLKKLTDIMATTLLMDKLTNYVLDEILGQMRISRGAFILLSSKQENVIEYSLYKKYESSPILSIKEVGDFLNNDALINFEEIEEGPLKDLMRSLNLSVVLTLSVQNEKIGLLCLGEKLSGDIYSGQDLSLFQILAPELSVAVNNSREVEEIKKFNVTLREEIDKATSELKKANEKLQELDKLKDEFVSLASHELRTPMTVIKSYIWLLLEGKVGEISEKQKTYLNRTYASANRLIAMVNDMLNISRIESGRFTVEPKPMSMVSLITEVVSEMQARAAEQQLTLSFETSEAEPLMVNADADRIKQVLINLIGNSLKFTPQAGSITLSVEQKDGFLITHVKDTGQGIKAEDMEKLFKKFNMLGGNYLTKQTGQGTGLGLYLSKSLVELHHGRIWVESEGEGKGSIFSFTLPIAQTPVV